MRDPVHYILQIARNEANDALKRSYGNDAVSLDERGGPDPIDIDAATGERRARQEDLSRIMARALGKVRSLERTALRLRFCEGLGNAAAAGKLGIDVEGCARIRYRAPARLRKALGKMTGGEEGLRRLGSQSRDARRIGRTLAGAEP